MPIPHSHHLHTSKLPCAAVVVNNVPPVAHRVGMDVSHRQSICHIVCRGYLSTLHKQGVALLAALETVFAGQPLYPAFA